MADPEEVRLAVHHVHLHGRRARWIVRRRRSDHMGTACRHARQRSRYPGALRDASGLARRAYTHADYRREEDQNEIDRTRLRTMDAEGSRRHEGTPRAAARG